MIASLGMYDWPELRRATDAWWMGLRRHLVAAGFRDVPETFLRDANHEAWRSDALLLSQTCGYPLTHAFRGQLIPIGTPCYDAPGCSGSNYCSAIVVNAASRANSFEDLRGKTAAYNSSDSLSGHLALRSLAAPCGTPR